MPSRILIYTQKKYVPVYVNELTVIRVQLIKLFFLIIVISRVYLPLCTSYRDGVRFTCSEMHNNFVVICRGLFHVW